MNPNIELKKVINLNEKFFQGFSINRFDYFILNKIIYIAVPSVFYLGTNTLFIYKINKFFFFEKILSLEGHKFPIILVKNFFDKNNNINYLLTSDSFSLVRIWKIENENSIKIKQTIDINYSGLILSALILFNNNNNNNKIILTSDNYLESSCEYSFDNNNFIKYIPNTKHQTYYIMSYNNNNDIIELVFDKIFFYNSLNNNTYEIKNENTKEINFYGNINNNLLFVSNLSKGKILVINLDNKNIIKIIDTFGENNLRCLIKWNNNYLIGNDEENKCLYIIDINQMKIINKIKVKSNPMYINVILSEKEIYNMENILLLLDNKLQFDLWTPRNI